ncbi:Sugar kinase of the NBD/HSP70 family, may contain an N-terminal HTH domain [Devosia lucknowensis]|uniref:Sugar kinase of the NBD/HSP70 family, may contain an N-terminal HTH domain n=1 Tax=Devosia lucknowensis TaxID=1096929 RepID=A0A1Y6GB01_9HYPH|nr:ROK family transcriptional regulator [Devosia lucknowensis]SMQ85597.1 Sugar kinase of the NBD/HSP70 family, may contain an N-terminal HTH domain [Devosia lucknowensis]
MRDVFDVVRAKLSHQDVRRTNEKAVLTSVAFNPGASNAEISRLSGLAPQTVSAILVDLEEQDLIRRGEVLRGRRGQPATPLWLNPEGGYAIGIELGWRHLDIILLNLHAVVLEHRHLDYDYPDARTIIATIVDLIGDITRDLTPHQRSRLLDIGIAKPSRLGANLRSIDAPTEQVDLWSAIDLKTALQEKTGLSVSVTNDGTSGCWAELIAHSKPRPPTMIYLLVSNFVGGGVLGDGVLIEGPSGNAGELGSILVSTDASGPKPAHHVASLEALRWELGAAGEDTGGTSHKALIEATDAGRLDAWLTRSAQALAQVIYNTVTVVEQPIVIVDTIIGGDFTARLVDLVRSELDLLPKRPWTPPIFAGQLGPMAPVMGAAELTLFRRYF